VPSEGCAICPWSRPLGVAVVALTVAAARSAGKSEAIDLPTLARAANTKPAHAAEMSSDGQVVKHVLVVGVELLSRVVDWSDRTTCVLFGDGAGAAVLGPADGVEARGRKRGILTTKLKTDGPMARSLIIPAGGTESPVDAAAIEARTNKVHMKGQDIFKVAVNNLRSSSQSALDALEMGTTLRVTATALNLRNAATTSSTILDVLDNGAIVTCIQQSGGNGWVHVETASGEEGWVSRTYVEVVPDGGSGATCDPARAEGAVGNFQKALHDSIAWAEGTRDFSQDGYDVMFSFKLMGSCQSHPNQCLKFGSSCSTAAGRYQFLIGTWGSVKSANGLTNFEPESQEVGAKYLVSTVRHVTVPQSRAMTASELSNAMSKLSWEWASLPPGRYGQPNKSASQMRNMYCNLAGC